MAKKESVVSYRPSFSNIPALFLSFIGYLSLAASLVFIIVGFGVESWDLLSSASFWTVINSFWIGAMLSFYFSDRLR